MSKRFLFLLLSLFPLFHYAAADSRPNIILIYPDDMRWDTLGVVQKEQGENARFPWLQTPRMDRLAAESIRFRQSFVISSLCSPARASVMTSRYGHHNGIIGNQASLPPDSVTFAQHLQKAGYTTAYCGKWHLDGQTDRPHYDFSASFVGQGKYNDCPLLVNGVETPTRGWVDDVTTGYAIDFIEQQSDEKPFFLWLGFKSPHGPRGGENLPARVRNLYVEDEPRPTPNTGLTAIYLEDKRAGGGGRTQGIRDFMRHITAIDDCVGRLLDALELAGLAENTLILLTSDNGYYLGEHSAGDKRTAYDESLRVPLLVRLPGTNPRGGTHEAMVLNTDYAPTILDFAGAKPLPDAQGRSLRPLLEARTPSDWRTAFFYTYFREGNFGQPTTQALRTTTHKLIKYPGHEEWTEIFDLRKDPYETQNLVTNTSLLKSLQIRFDQEAKTVGFQWPEGFVP